MVKQKGDGSMENNTAINLAIVGQAVWATCVIILVNPWIGLVCGATAIGITKAIPWMVNKKEA